MLLYFEKSKLFADSGTCLHSEPAPSLPHPWSDCMKGQLFADSWTCLHSQPAPSLPHPWSDCFEGQLFADSWTCLHSQPAPSLPHPWSDCCQGKLFVHFQIDQHDSATWWVMVELNFLYSLLYQQQDYGYGVWGDFILNYYGFKVILRWFYLRFQGYEGVEWNI